MTRNKDRLVTGEVYHTFSRSIARFKIFNHDADFSRIMEVVRYYQNEKPLVSFSNSIKTMKIYSGNDFSEKEKLVAVIAFCIMPTHLHLVLKQLKDNGISKFMSNVLNSYTRYFNIKHKRKGPLWEGRFKSVFVKKDEQLLHLTRYVHLNPVTEFLVKNPEEWPASSYKEYITGINNMYPICNYINILEINPSSYKKFVEDGIAYQRDLAKIKRLICE